MTRHALALFAAAPLALAAPAEAVEVQVQATNPVVEMQVSQQVLGEPDKATIGAGVSTRGQTAVAAMQANARQMDAVLARLKALGVPDERVQTSGITLSPQYNYRNDLPPQFNGYEATNTVTIELRDLERVGPILDALIAAGATNLNGPSWGITDPAPAQSQARAKAYDAALKQGREYARMAGYSDVRLLAVEEQLGFQQPVYDQMARVEAAPAVKASTPTRPGRVATQVTLTAKFELTR